MVQDEATDADLAGRAGAGDLEAFEALYRRHAEAAWRMALAVTANPDDAADAVSDAFTRVFQALPDRLHAADYFLPYLLAAVRNAAIDALRRGGRVRPTDPRDQYDWSVLGNEPSELMVADTDALLVARAFRSLPERWRSVLWLTEVEGIPPREVAGLLGVSANGVAQLAVRARAGLRQRYLQAHLRQSEVGAVCRETVNRLGAYAAGALSPRDISKVDQHLAGCDPCRSRLAELDDVAPGLRRAVLPLPAGLAALVVGKWQLSTTASASAGATSTGLTTTATSGAAAATGAAAPIGVGIGAAVVLPTPFVTSVASVALLVAGFVGVGAVNLNGRGSAAPPGSHATFSAAASAGPDGAPVDLAAALVAEGARAATGIADAVTALPDALPELEPPDPAELEGLARGDVNVDMATVSVTADLTAGLATCPSFRVFGVQLGCQLPSSPPTGPAPADEATALTSAGAQAAAGAEAAGAEAASEVVTEAVDGDGAVAPPPG
ncbi:MAG: sigma-70 family RNA polymerase sigma factor [Actinomycetota bacterium]